MARRPLKPNTQGGRLIRALVSAWPGYAGGPLEFGNDFYTARNRMGDTLAPRGFRTINRQRRDRPWYEWRFETDEIYQEAALLVRSWDLGIDVRLLRAREAFQANAFAGAPDPDPLQGGAPPRLTGPRHPFHGRQKAENDPPTGRGEPRQAELDLASEGGAHES